MTRVNANTPTSTQKKQIHARYHTLSLTNNTVNPLSLAPPPPPASRSLAEARHTAHRLEQRKVMTPHRHYVPNQRNMDMHVAPLSPCAPRKYVRHHHVDNAKALPDNRTEATTLFHIQSPPYPTLTRNFTSRHATSRHVTSRHATP